MAAAAEHRGHRQQPEQSELEGQGDRQQGGDDPGDRRGRGHPDQEDARQEDLEDAEQSGGEQPPPMIVEPEWTHREPPCWPGAGTARMPSLLPRASRANSPMPPSVPISWVASTGNRIVLALGERANSPIASTYFWAMK